MTAGPTQNRFFTDGAKKSAPNIEKSLKAIVLYCKARWKRKVRQRDVF